MNQRTPLSLFPFGASLCAALLAFGCGGAKEAPSSSPAPTAPATGTPSAATPGTSQPAPAPATGSPSAPTAPSTGTEPVEPAPAPAPSPTATLPSELLDLRAWKLTLPIDTEHSGHPDEILQPELATYVSDQYFHLNAEKNGVVFTAPIEGSTTSGSGYPRSELREMTADGKDLAVWSTTSGKHTMFIRQAITHLPEVKHDVVAGQIHGGSSDLIEIRLEGTHLFVAADGPNVGTLDENYTLGTVFTIKVEAANGHVKVYYNDVLKVDYATTSSTNYFKAGMYTQSNLSKGDAPGAYGESVIYELKVTHE